MSDIKISQLPEVTSLSSTDIGPVVATGVTSKITIQNLATSLPLVTSASYALTASFALNGGGSGVPFPYTGSAEITGSLTVTGSVSSTGGFTGSLFGTSSWAVSSSYSLSSSVAISSSYALSASYVLSSSYAVLSSQTVSASYALTSSYSVSSSYALSSSYSLSGSYAITASYALNAASATSGLTSQIATGSVTASVNVVSASFRVTSASVVLFSVDRGGAITASRAFLSASNNMASGSTLIVYGSGSAQPVFTVQGSQGELFSVNDALSGSLFSVNDISGLPILEAFSDNRVLIGSYQAPALFTTVRTVSVQGANVIYSVPTASYDAVFFEYSLRSGSNCRAGQIMSIWSGSDTNWTETVTADFGNTTGVAFRTIITGSNMALTGSFPSASWVMKTIVRSV